MSAIGLKLPGKHNRFIGIGVGQVGLLLGATICFWASSPAALPIVSLHTLENEAPALGLDSQPDHDGLSPLGPDLASEIIGQSRLLAAGPATSFTPEAPNKLVEQAAGADAKGRHADTVRDVLRSMVTVRRTFGAQTDSLVSSHGDMTQGVAGDEQAEEGGSLVEALLDNRTLASALLEIVQISGGVDEPRSFSLLGLGNFEIDVAPNIHAVMISDLSNTSAVYFDSSTGGTGAVTAVPRTGTNIVKLAWRFLLEFLSSPIGIAISVLLTVCAFFAAAVKLVSALARLAR